jgi:pimeloyl-ACP methyl ester carboxylesterase
MTDRLELSNLNEIEPINFVVVHGGWQQPLHIMPLADALRARGHQAITPELDIEDPDKNHNDDAQAVAHAIGERKRVVLIGNSRGGESVSRVHEHIDLDQILAVFLVNSGGLHGYQLQPERPGEPQLQRYSRRYASGIRMITSRMTEYDPRAAERVWYNDLRDSEKLEIALAGLRRQRTPEASDTGSIPLIPREIPRFFVIGKQDRFFNPEHCRRVARQWLGVKATYLYGGHSLAYTQPDPLADLILKRIKDPWPQVAMSRQSLVN